MEDWEKIIQERTAAAGHKCARRDELSARQPLCKGVSLEFPKHYVLLVHDAATENGVVVYFGVTDAHSGVRHERAHLLWSRQYGVGAPETREEILTALITLLDGGFPPPPRGVEYLGFYLLNFLETQGWSHDDLSLERTAEDSRLIQMYAGEDLRGGLMLGAGAPLTIFSEIRQSIQWHADLNLEGLEQLSKRLHGLDLQGPGETYPLITV